MRALSWLIGVAALLATAFTQTTTHALDCSAIEVCHDPLRDVYFLVDISNSVEQLKVDTTVKDYLKQVYCLFQATDSNQAKNPQIGMGLFNGIKIYNILDLKSYASEDDWRAAVDNAYDTGIMKVVGNTPMAEAFALAKNVMAQKGVSSAIHPNRLKHVIMITDGEPNPLVNIAPSPNNVPPMDSPLKNPIENGNLTFDFYQQDAVAQRPVPSYACGTLFDKYAPPATVSSSIPGCRVRTMDQYLFTDVYNQAQAIINMGIRLSAIALPDKYNFMSNMSLILGQGNDIAKCKGSLGNYCSSDVCYCRIVTEGKCACNTPKGPLISKPIEWNLFTASFTVDSLLEETRNILCPDTLAPTAAIVTKAPTTRSPTTRSPTTSSPTTASPTTKSPTTSSPTTASPTTKSPTTKCGVCTQEETGWALGPTAIKFSTGWGGYFLMTPGQVLTGNIMAGQNLLAGTYTITWTSDRKINFSFQLCENWVVKQTVHFYYSMNAPGSNPGSFTKKFDLPGSQSYTMTPVTYNFCFELYVALHLELKCKTSYLQIGQEANLRGAGYDYEALPMEDDEQGVLTP